MKKIIIPMAAIMLISVACNNTGKDSVEKADSANAANLDTALNRNTVTIDEASSAFLVRVANNGMAETDIASYVEQHAAYADVKSFAGMLFRDHSGVNQAVAALSASKQVVLPAILTPEKKEEVDKLKAKTGKELDKAFISMMISNHQSSIESFEKAMTETKDPDVRSFADKTLPALRAHLDSAKSLEKKYWK